MRFTERAVRAALLAAAWAGTAAANDSVAVFGAGGLVQLGKEPRVVMARERLTISRTHVRVEYAFVNESPEDVVTQVAFPIPPYGLDQLPDPGDGPSHGRYGFDGWTATADGEPIRSERQVRAVVGERDVTDLLAAHGIDALRFGDHDGQGGERYAVRKLPRKVRAELRALGIVDRARDDWPLWKIAVTHHWTQRFPAGRTVTVVHDYAPVTGGAVMVGRSADEFAKAHRDACLDARTAAGLARRIERRLAGGQGFPGFANVRYILTTANTWKQPIREFELVIERAVGELVTFCWDGRVEADGATRLLARAVDFVPRRELDVYFISD